VVAANIACWSSATTSTTAFEELAVWALSIAREVPHPNQLAIRLGEDDPLSGAFVRIHSVVQILDRSALRDNHGFVSHTTMTSVEEALREFLELPRPIDRRLSRREAQRWPQIGYSGSSPRRTRSMRIHRSRARRSSR
jgi:mRNA interferase MazF